MTTQKIRAELVFSATSETLPIDADNIEYSFEYSHSNRPIKLYVEDSLGKFYLFTSTIHYYGIVQAQNESDAYEAFLDELADRVPVDQIHEAYGFDTADEFIAYRVAHEGIEWDRDLIEGYSFMPNAHGTSGIVSHDLNGERQILLTPANLAHYMIRMFISF